MYKTIIFDFNGTLLDDCDICVKILNILCQKNHLNTVSKEEYKEIFNFPVIDYYRKAGFTITKESFDEISHDFHKLYNEFSYKEVDLFPTVRETLDYLFQKYSIVCLSATRQDTLEKQLGFYRIDHYFDALVGSSDLYGSSKEAVGIDYINRNNIDPEEVILVGDTLHDFEVAKAMNVECILVSSGHNSKKRLLETKSLVIDDLVELKKYL